MSTHLMQSCPPHLRALTQHEYFAVFANGTMALTAAMHSMASSGTNVGLPALGCWTVSKAALDAGLSPRYHEVTDQLDVRGPRAEHELTVAIRPWLGPVGAVGRSAIVDLSVNVGMRAGVTPGAACVISLGPSKPAAHSLHGGILALSDQGLMRSVSEATRMHVKDGRWMRLGPRLTTFPLSAGRR